MHFFRVHSCWPRQVLIMLQVPGIAAAPDGKGFLSCRCRGAQALDHAAAKNDDVTGLTRDSRTFSKEHRDYWRSRGRPEIRPAYLCRARSPRR